MDDRSRTAISYRYERGRALSAGVIEAAGTIFLLLMAVRWYKAGPLAKAMIAGGGSVGLILALWVVSRVEAWGWPVAKAAARLAALGAASFLVMALVPVLPVYVAGCVRSNVVGHPSGFGHHATVTAQALDEAQAAEVPALRVVLICKAEEWRSPNL